MPGAYDANYLQKILSTSAGDLSAAGDTYGKLTRASLGRIGTPEVDRAESGARAHAAALARRQGGTAPAASSLENMASATRADSSGDSIRAALAQRQGTLMGGAKLQGQANSVWSRLYQLAEERRRAEEEADQAALSSVLGLGGMVAGFAAGGPPGAMIGGQVGQQAGKGWV